MLEEKQKEPGGKREKEMSDDELTESGEET